MEWYYNVNILCVGYNKDIHVWIIKIVNILFQLKLFKIFLMYYITSYKI